MKVATKIRYGAITMELLSCIIIVSGEPRVPAVAAVRMQLSNSSARSKPCATSLVRVDLGCERGIRALIMVESRLDEDWSSKKF